MVTRDGQRSAWLPLPHDSLGSVLDPTEVTARVGVVLELLMALDVPVSAEVGFAIAVGPVQMMTVGDASVVGRRSSASMPLMYKERIEVPADDAIDIAAARAGSSQVAEELVARLVAQART
jgi:hypothetical protein